MGLVVRLMRNTLQRSGLSLLSILLVMACSFPAWGANACTDFVADGSFEQGLSPSPWLQSSTNFGSPLCDPLSCSAVHARTGSWWSWFGGTIQHEVAALEQRRTIPLGIVQLKFYLWNALPATFGTDIFRVTLEGNELFSSISTAPAYQTGYTPVVLDLSAYADGMPHTLRFESIIDSDANIYLDDVARIPNETFINYNPISKTIVRKNDLQLQPVIDNSLISQEIRGQNSITSQGEDITVNLSDAASMLAMRGGFGCDLADNSGGLLTAVRSMTISSGRVVAENMITLGHSVVPGLVVKADGRFVAKNVVLR